MFDQRDRCHGRRAKIRVASATGVLLLVMAMWSAVYSGRVHDHDRLVAGCKRAIERSKNDIAQDADLSTVVAADRVSEVRRRRSASKLLLVNCSKEYPAPSVWPWGG